MAHLAAYFSKSDGKPGVDDRRVLSGIIFVNRNGLRWRDAPREYGPHKTLYKRPVIGVDLLQDPNFAASGHPQALALGATFIRRRCL